MPHTKNILHAKVQYLQSELEALKDYFYVPETYQYLIEELDAQQVLLKHLEVEDAFTSINQQTDSSTDIAPGTPEK